MVWKSLKVFQAQFDFYDVVVAAPSQAAALRAWGVHQKLFTDGMARARPRRRSDWLLLQWRDEPIEMLGPRLTAPDATLGSKANAEVLQAFDVFDDDRHSLSLAIILHLF